MRTTPTRPAASQRNPDYARDAVFAAFRPRHARALDEGAFVDRLPDQLARRHIDVGGEEHVVSQVGGEAGTTTPIVKRQSAAPFLAKELVNIAERIRARIRRTTEDWIETGRDLIQVKDTLKHGEFITWISAEFDMTSRTAQRYMQVAKWAEGKNDIVSHLPLTTIHLLATKTTPEEIKAKVISDIGAGKPIDMHDVKSRVKMARTERQLEHRVDLQKQERNRKRSAKYQRQRERENTEHEARQKRAKEAVQEVCSILLKLDTPDLDRLVELLDTAKNIGFGSLGSLPEALAHAMRGAEA